MQLVSDGSAVSAPCRTALPRTRVKRQAAANTMAYRRRLQMELLVQQRNRDSLLRLMQEINASLALTEEMIVATAGALVQVGRL